MGKVRSTFFRSSPGEGTPVSPGPSRKVAHTSRRGQRGRWGRHLERCGCLGAGCGRLGDGRPRGRSIRPRPPFRGVFRRHPGARPSAGRDVLEMVSGPTEAAVPGADLVRGVPSATCSSGRGVAGSVGGLVDSSSGSVPAPPDRGFPTTMRRIRGGEDTGGHRMGLPSMCRATLAAFPRRRCVVAWTGLRAPWRGCDVFRSAVRESSLLTARSWLLSWLLRRRGTTGRPSEAWRSNSS